MILGVWICFWILTDMPNSLMESESGPRGSAPAICRTRVTRCNQPLASLCLPWHHPGDGRMDTLIFSNSFFFLPLHFFPSYLMISSACISHMSFLVFEDDFISCLWRNLTYNVIQYIASKHPECCEPASHTLILISKSV